MCTCIADRKVDVPAAGGHVHRHNTGIERTTVQRTVNNAGCSTAGHLRTQDVSYMIRSAWQVRKTRTDRLGSTTEVTTVVTNDEHVCTGVMSENKIQPSSQDA